MLLAALVYPSFKRTDEQAAARGLRKRNLKKDKKKSESMCVHGRSSRIMDHSLAMPPSLPMVFSVRSYERAVRVPRLGGGFDGGRIANQVQDEPNYRSAG